MEPTEDIKEMFEFIGTTSTIKSAYYHEIEKGGHYQSDVKVAEIGWIDAPPSIIERMTAFIMRRPPISRKKILTMTLTPITQEELERPYSEVQMDNFICGLCGSKISPAVGEVFACHLCGQHPIKGHMETVEKKKVADFKRIVDALNFIKCAYENDIKEKAQVLEMLDKILSGEIAVPHKSSLEFAGVLFKFH